MATVAPETAAAAPTAPGEQVVVGKSPRQLFWARFKEDKAAFLGLGLILLLVLLAVGAGVIARLVGHGPNELFQEEMTDEFGLPKGPNGEFWFGADTNG